MASIPGNNDDKPAPLFGAVGAPNPKRAVDWVPSLGDRNLADESETDACNQLLILITGGQNFMLEGMNLKVAWPNMVRQLYPWFQSNGWIWMGTSAIKYWAMRELYKKNNIQLEKPVHTLGFTPPPNVIEEIDEGYSNYLKANHPIYYEHNKHRIPKKKVSVASPAVGAAESSRKDVQVEDIEPQNDGHNKPEVPTNASNMLSPLQAVTINSGTTTPTPTPTPSAPVVTMPPSKFESMVLAARKDLKKYWEDCGGDKILLDKDGYPFEVRVPDRSSPDVAKYIYRNAGQMAKVNKILDPRLRLCWIDHDEATFLVIVKNDMRGDYDDIISYPESWNALRAWSQSVADGQVATLGEFVRSYNDKARVEAMQAYKEIAEKEKLAEALEEHDATMASSRRQAEHEQL
ncbi:hypothetical protein CaCOL14_004298 [Colletotrichum acutatum]|uniref:Uncharacterized protein n=1 Tax=Glomerella acutata TaxID=27357 RepID=A0AAD8UG90_GLOAC|nr:uncharacterized protein BDZ83DRAFT_733759 [Colletotrichum acutatum]KAK1717479.1 hypothetical protein BDZ83DRAFT_733759 [Colletotrichum acutatum]